MSAAVARAHLPLLVRLALLLALVAATAAAHADPQTPVTVVVADGVCPARAQVEDALARQGFRPTREVAPFRIDVFGETGSPRVELRERGGGVLLDRPLPVGECESLAETIALLVERRLAGIAWHAPPVAPPAPVARPTPPAAPPTARAAPRAAVSGRVAPTGRWSLDLLAGGVWATGLREDVGQPGGSLALRLRPPAAVGIRLAVAMLSPAVVPASTGSFHIVRTPFTLAAGWSPRWSRVELDLELCAELERLATESRGIAAPRADTWLALRAGPAVTLGLGITPELWLALHGAVLPVVSGWFFVVHRLDDPSAKTRVASQVTAVELGLSVLWRLGLERRREPERPD